MNEIDICAYLQNQKYEEYSGRKKQKQPAPFCSYGDPMARSKSNADFFAVANFLKPWIHVVENFAG